MKNQKKYIALQVIAGAFIAGIMFGAGNARGDEEPLYEYAKKAKIDWQQAKGQTIHVVSPSWYAIDYMGKKQAPIFEKLTGAKVVWEYLPADECKIKSKIDLVSGAGKIDLPYTPLFRIAEYMTAGWVEPLDLYLNDPKLTDKEWFNIDDLVLGLRNVPQLDGKTYALPHFAETAILYYRKDVFEEKGLCVPDSWYDLMETAKKLYDPPRLYSVTLRTSKVGWDLTYDWVTVFRSFGGQFFADFPRDLTPVVNSPEGVAATQYYADLAKYGPPGSEAMDFVETQQLCNEGLVAMDWDDYSWVFGLQDPAKSKTAGKWGFAPVPYGPAGRHPMLWSLYFPINKRSRNKTAAWLFLEFIESPLAVYERESAERVSIWQKIVKKGTIMGQKTEWFYDWAMAYATDLAFVNANHIPVIPEYGEYSDRIGMRLSEVLTGVTDVQTGMDKLQEDFEKIFRKG